MNDLASKRTTRRGSNRCGATALEFAIVGPVVFLILLTSFEFFRIQMIQNMADVAAYEACRLVMVPGATIQEGEAEAQKYLNFLGTRRATITVTPYENGVPKATLDDFTTHVQVTVSIPVRGNALILARFFGGTIDASTTLKFEGYTGFYDGATE